MGKKLKLPPKRKLHDIEGLEGFEEIIEEWSDLDDQGGGVTKDSRADRFGPAGYEVYHYLENELSRLEKSNFLFETRLKTQMDNDISDNLIAEQADKNALIREDIIDLLLDRRSPMTNRLSALWSNAFSLRKGR